MSRRLIALWTLATLFVISALMHNAIYAVLGVEEAVFFLLAIASLGAFALGALIVIATAVLSGHPHDAFKLGFIGIVFFTVFAAVGATPSAFLVPIALLLCFALRFVRPQASNTPVSTNR